MISIVVGDPVEAFTLADISRAEMIDGVTVECPYMDSLHLARITLPMLTCDTKVISAIQGGHHKNIVRRRDLR